MAKYEKTERKYYDGHVLQSTLRELKVKFEGEDIRIEVGDDSQPKFFYGDRDTWCEVDSDTMKEVMERHGESLDDWLERMTS